MPKPRPAHAQRRNSSRRLWLIAGGAAAVLAALAVIAALVLQPSSKAKTASSPSTTAVPSTLPATTTSAPPTTAASTAVCPLTGASAPGGTPPARPALAVKIGNDPAARPQSGLSNADIVFEEPIEGNITRLLAVYQCQEAPEIGPVRSTRWIDTQLLGQFGHPAFAFAGGIIPDVNLVADSSVYNLDLFTHSQASTRITSRYAPENLYTSTSALWALDPSKTPPSPIFHYGKPSEPGTPTSEATLLFSGILNVQWRWDASTAKWVRLYAGVPNVDADGTPVTATNVVIERVTTSPGTIPEDVNGALGVHSQTVGSGQVTILTGGSAYNATWSRPNTSVPTQFVGPNGQPVNLAPGSTWVELLPVQASLQLTQASPLTSPSTSSG
ncbi:MAG: DUF3048 domain-containing protein [Acidimicrobiales bacterium]